MRTFMIFPKSRPYAKIYTVRKPWGCLSLIGTYNALVEGRISFPYYSGAVMRDLVFMLGVMTAWCVEIDLLSVRCQSV